MSTNKDLWAKNQPAQFWQTANEFEASQWRLAIHNSVSANKLPFHADDIEHLLNETLGEGRFGDNHWDIRLFTRSYWQIKPYLPRGIIRRVRSFVHKAERKLSNRYWPIDDRYMRFQWETMRQLLLISGNQSIAFKNFWPDNYSYSLVLTHDIETEEGYSFIPDVAQLEEKKGFRSSFNIVGNQIPKDVGMFRELEDRGFEIGLHGWEHDSTLYQSHIKFKHRVKLINDRLQNLGAVGFRSPYNLRQPEWMQELNIEYDLSFFDTDPFEPIPGGSMSIWPFRIGSFIELPATLVQDNTLVNLLGETTPQIWLDKIEFIKKYHGMALVNTHPDYLIKPNIWKVYENFLEEMKEREGYWNALPREAARWWRFRTEKDASKLNFNQEYIVAKLVDNNLVIA